MYEKQMEINTNEPNLALFPFRVASTTSSSFKLNKNEESNLSYIFPRRSASSCVIISPTYSIINSFFSTFS